MKYTKTLASLSFSEQKYNNIQPASETIDRILNFFS